MNTTRATTEGFIKPAYLENRTTGFIRIWKEGEDEPQEIGFQDKTIRQIQTVRAGLQFLGYRTWLFEVTQLSPFKASVRDLTPLLDQIFRLEAENHVLSTY